MVWHDTLACIGIRGALVVRAVGACGAVRVAGARGVLVGGVLVGRDTLVAGAVRRLVARSALVTDVGSGLLVNGGLAGVLLGLGGALVAVDAFPNALLDGLFDVAVQLIGRGPFFLGRDDGRGLAHCVEDRLGIEVVLRCGLADNDLVGHRAFRVFALGALWLLHSHDRRVGAVRYH